MESQTQDPQAAVPSFCTSCGATLAASPAALFCGMCGVKVAGAADASTLSPKNLGASQWVKIVLASLVIFVPVFFFTSWKTGTIPTDTVSQAMKAGEAPFELPAKDKVVQEAALAAPSDTRLQNEYAAVLVRMIRDSKDEPSQALVLEAVEQLSKILVLNPLEPDALLSLADISFNQQIFAKASELYQRFLALRPNDEDVRARYGSALMFQGEFDRSIEQQNQVLTKNPKNFQSAAYLAVALAQKGQVTEARAAADRALQLAPNEEARTRLQTFVDSLDKNKDAVTASAPQARQETGAVTPQTPIESSDTKSSSRGALESALRSNPVAGRKFGSISVAGGIATVTMIDFPMQAMPPVAKEKFYSSIAPAVDTDKITTVIFIDRATGQEMERKQF